jgi:hypothetical protein
MFKSIVLGVEEIINAANIRQSELIVWGRAN